jgi:NAD(P)-dependent dehydrogenase (short-subunit alcohol dehydrogenase family)
MALEIDYQDKTVAVVGGTSGINQGIALGFAELGARIAVASRKQDKVDATVGMLERMGVTAFGAVADVRDFDAVTAFFERAHAALGEFDVLVSGAAGNFPALVNGMSPNAFKTVVDIDLNGTFNVMRAAYPYLVKPGASVINISAPQAFVPMQAQAHVCAAKAGVDMMTRCLALEWGGAGIRVNSIVPGPIQGTEGMDRLAPTAAQRAEVIESVPLQRMGTREDIARAAAFLGCELASYVSGIVMPVDGGWSTAGVAGLGNALAQIAQAPR